MNVHFWYIQLHCKKSLRCLRCLSGSVPKLLISMLKFVSSILAWVSFLYSILFFLFIFDLKIWNFWSTLFYAKTNYTEFTLIFEVLIIKKWIRNCPEKITMAKKLAVSKKSTVLSQSSSYSLKIVYSWGSHFDKVSRWLL